MASDSTEIANLALGRIGQPAILSIDDPNPTARVCKRFYDQTRDAVLRAHRWNFAIKRDTLTQLATPPPFEWDFAYQLPSDCLRILTLNDIDEEKAADFWEIEGRHLLTDEEIAEVKYIWRVTDEHQFDSLFVDALSLKLAASVAKSVTTSVTIAQGLLQEYESITGPLARRTDAFEAHSTRRLPWVESDLVRSRFGGPLG